MLSDDIERYIALRRATGFQFTTEACRLRQFARAAAAVGDDVVRSDTVMAWAGQAPSAKSRSDRFHTVRRLAQAMAVEDPRYEVPPIVSFGREPRRWPHIYTAAEIGCLLDAAAKLGPRGSLRPRTYVTLFALLASTGLRVSEALALHLDDLTPAGLVIQQAKFHKSRLVPLHQTTRRSLHRYLALRTRTAGLQPTIFVSSRGTALPYNRVVATFLSLVRRIGMHPGPGRPGPRIHDFRHTFAVRALERCTGDHDAIRRHMVALSTYLGHAHITYTYWYLQTTPALMREIAAASEALAARGAP
jgi:integrase